MKRILEFIKEHKRLVGIAAGVLMAVLILTINLWRTLLIILFGWLGWFFTGGFDWRSKILKVLSKFYSEDR